MREGGREGGREGRREEGKEGEREDGKRQEGRERQREGISTEYQDMLMAEREKTRHC